MKNVTVAELPTCDIHKHFESILTVPARFDGPTRLGSHAYMCEVCHEEYGIPGSSITTRLTTLADEPAVLWFDRG